MSLIRQPFVFETVEPRRLLSAASLGGLTKVDSSSVSAQAIFSAGGNVVIAGRIASDRGTAFYTSDGTSKPVRRGVILDGLQSEYLGSEGTRGWFTRSERDTDDVVAKRQLWTVDGRTGSATRVASGLPAMQYLGTISGRAIFQEFNGPESYFLYSSDGNTLTKLTQDFSSPVEQTIKLPNNRLLLRTEDSGVSVYSLAADGTGFFLPLNVETFDTSMVVSGRYAFIEAFTPEPFDGQAKVIYRTDGASDFLFPVYDTPRDVALAANDGVALAIDTRGTHVFNGKNGVARLFSDAFTIQGYESSKESIVGGRLIDNSGYKVRSLDLKSGEIRVLADVSTGPNEIPAVGGHVYLDDYGRTDGVTFERSESSFQSPIVHNGSEYFLEAGRVFVSTPQLAGTIFADSDADFVRDTNEQGISGLRVYLDLDGDGRWDKGEPRTYTNGDGSYALYDLAVGTWRVRVNADIAHSAVSVKLKILSGSMRKDFALQPA